MAPMVNKSYSNFRQDCACIKMYPQPIMPKRVRGDALWKFLVWS